ALLRRAMPKIENGDRDVLLQQHFIEGVPTELKRELLQRPSMSYEETVAQQLDLASQISSHLTGSQVNQASASDNLQTTTRDQPLVAQLMENMETLTRKVSELSVSVANVNAKSARNSTRGRRGPCYKCGKMGHVANECRSTGTGSRQPNYRQRSAENYCFTRIGAHEQKCLVDTGATVSLISRELISGPLKPCSLKARGIGGEELQVLGMKESEVSIGTLTISHQFMVVGMGSTCILGADFLTSNGRGYNKFEINLAIGRSGVSNRDNCTNCQ
ncbi:gap-Pol poly, partial, partial [Paramuricea clavata]